MRLLRLLSLDFPLALRHGDDTVSGLREPVASPKLYFRRRARLWLRSSRAVETELARNRNRSGMGPSWGAGGAGEMRQARNLLVSFSRFETHGMTQSRIGRAKQ